MRRQRTIYHNDARHYYLWSFEPPISLEDAWHPVDEVAGTAIDTFSYCVERGDGAFYPTNVGMLFGTDIRPFTSAITWRAWESMHSLTDRGLDPLQVLIDRAHQKGMDFFADLRMAKYGGMDPAHMLDKGGRGWAHEEVRDHQLAVAEELLTRYPIDGLEIDFPAAFSGRSYYFRPEDMQAGKDLMTGWIRQASKLARTRPGAPAVIGARILPTEQMNLDQGLDVRKWLKERLLDFVVPMLYSYNNLDADMPFDWVIEPAHEAGASVYGMLQPYIRDEKTVPDNRGYLRRIHPSSEQMRAAMASYWDRGVDGLYTWFMKWPLGDTEKRILSEMDNPDITIEKNKHYVARRRDADAEAIGYGADLPFKIDAAHPDKPCSVSFYFADDIQAKSGRIRQVSLKTEIANAVSRDQFSFFLNGQSLAEETCLRSYGRTDAPRDMWFEFHLHKVRPCKGWNRLEISLNTRPAGLAGEVTVEEVHVFIEYSPYPSGCQ